ncbi:HutD family protein [Paraburkholderia aspalathi]|nr:HutD family protein [Paraburkholderia aspalathi]
MPWKNGGGVTVEIAIHPQGASVDNFDWRISTATVSADGPFSVFTGIDRTLSVLDGDGIVLVVAGLNDKILKGVTAPFSFPADSATSAKLIGSAITDLNVMTRRGRFRHSVQRHLIDGNLSLIASAETIVVFCNDGAIEITADNESENLQKGDCAVLKNTASTALMMTGKGAAYLIAIDSV